MNDLSWLIYLADVLPNLRESFGLFLLVSAASSVVLIVNYFITVANDELEKAILLKGFLKLTLPTTLVLTLLWAAIPSKDTIYLIAGSEAGEFVVNTPEAREILNGVKEVIQLQIEDLKPKDTP